VGKSISGAVHLGVAWLLVAGVLAQVYLAALGVFSDESAFQTHRDFGHLLEAFPVALAVTALLAGYGRNRALAAVGLLALLFLQTVLVLQRGSSDTLAALHPVNALLIFLAAVLLAWDSTRLWRSRRRRAAREMAPTT
jgi:uncharacterized membrane protein